MIKLLNEFLEEDGQHAYLKIGTSYAELVFPVLAYGGGVQHHLHGVACVSSPGACPYQSWEAP